MTAGFFSKPRRRPEHGPSRIDEDFARRLFSALRSHDPSTKGSIRAWAEDFRRLGEERREADVERVLNWFELHAGGRWTPAVRSARQFCSKFEQLLNACDRHEEDRPTVRVTDEARRICRSLGGLAWPGDEKRDELVLIQRSLDGFRDWMNLVRRAKERKPELAGICRWLLVVHGDARMFACSWVESVHRTAWTNERWAGKLGRHAATARHPRFQKMVSAWIAEYKGSRADWWSWFEVNFTKGDGR
jgi:hypothetical protein